MRSLLAISPVVVLIGLAGCGPQELIREQYVYVVQHDVPRDPSFVVLPQEGTAAETDFAERVEGVLLSAGHRVVNRPVPRLVETERAAVAGGSDFGEAMDGTEGRAAQARVTETYYALESVDADYVVYTRERVRRVRLTETEEEAEARPDRPTNPTVPGRYLEHVYDVARVRIVYVPTGEVVSSFELTLNSEATERLKEALSRVVGTSI